MDGYILLVSVIRQSRDDRIDDIYYIHFTFRTANCAYKAIGQ